MISEREEGGSQFLIFSDKGGRGDKTFSDFFSQGLMVRFHIGKHIFQEKFLEVFWSNFNLSSF